MAVAWRLPALVNHGSTLAPFTLSYHPDMHITKLILRTRPADIVEALSNCGRRLMAAAGGTINFIEAAIELDFPDGGGHGSLLILSCDEVQGLCVPGAKLQTLYSSIIAL